MKSRLLLFFVTLVFSFNAIGQGVSGTFTSGGVKFKITSLNPATVEVTVNEPDYSGSVLIPSTVTNQSVSYKVTAVGDYSFQGCIGLTRVSIPSSVTTIGASAFMFCGGLESIEIPSSVTSIGEGAFSFCDAIKTITFLTPSSLVTIGDNAFQDCNVLEAISIPPTVSYIGSYAFSGCYELTSVTIPQSVTTINDYTFWLCNNLTSVSLPETITTINDNAFSSCNSLGEVTIPSSVQTISSTAFYASSAIFSVDASNSNYASIDGVLFNKAITNLIQCPTTKTGEYIIPGTVTQISNEAFLHCCLIKSITIPSSVTTIGDNAFENCISLTSLICKSKDPNIASIRMLDKFSPTTCTLYIPSGTKAAYSSSKLWQGFEAYVEYDAFAALSRNYRGATLSNLSSEITCEKINDATSYKWRFVSTTSGVEKNDSNATTSLIPGKLGVNFGESYVVYVRAKVNGAWGEYGEGYTITTPVAPLTRLGAHLHNRKMKTIEDTVVCHKVAGATLYLYQFVDEKDATKRFRHYNKGNSLRVSDVDGIEYGRSYQVTVLPRFYNSLSQFSVGARIFTPPAK